jgi:putative ABC transport system substrate-binding protein
MTSRRQFIAGTALFLVAPRNIAQTAKAMPKIGVLRWQKAQLQWAMRELPRAVKERGYIEGKNIAFLWRSADQKSSQADEIVREFVRERVAIIVASPTPAAHAARRGTATIPIVLSGIADPVSSGLVTSLARPGGNITGVSLNLPAVAGKRVEVLRDAFPALKRIAFLGSSSDPATKVFVANTEQAARQLGLALQVELIPGSSEINAAFIKIAAGGAQAVIVQPIFWTLAKQISELALKNRLPTISDFGSFPRDGGLLSYGPNQSATFLIVADYMDKILNGAKPGDLPIQEPTRFELVVNMKTARRLGIKIPDTVMVRADRVIE